MIENTHPTHRSYSEIISYLQHIQEGNPHLSNLWVMAEALIYGYSTGRTGRTIESQLMHNPHLYAWVITLAESWDREDFIAGALRYAGTIATEYTNPKPLDPEWERNQERS